MIRWLNVIWEASCSLCIDANVLSFQPEIVLDTVDTVYLQYRGYPVGRCWSTIMSSDTLGCYITNCCSQTTQQRVNVNAQNAQLSCHIVALQYAQIFIPFPRHGGYKSWCMRGQCITEDRKQLRVWRQRRERGKQTVEQVSAYKDNNKCRPKVYESILQIIEQTRSCWI